MSIEQENSEKKASAHKPRDILAYEFLLNDSPLIDDRFLSDKSWFPFAELDECD